MMRQYCKKYLPPEQTPLGYTLLPLSDIIDPRTGKTKVTCWKLTDGADKVWKLNYLTYPTLPSAISGCDQILNNYQLEKATLTEIIGATKYVHHIFTNWKSNDWVDLKEKVCQSLFNNYRVLQFCILPEKQEAAEKFFAVATRKVRYGKKTILNPSAAAAQLIVAIIDLIGRKNPDIESIVTFISFRREILVQTRELSLSYLDRLTNELFTLIQDPWYRSKAHAPLNWCNEQSYQIERALVWGKGVWGAPYNLLVLDFTKQLELAISELKRQNQGKARSFIINAITQIDQAPKQLAGIARKLVTLSKVISIDKKMAFIKITEIGNMVPTSGCLQSSGESILTALASAKKYLEADNSSKYQAMVQIAIRRCRW